MTPRLSVRAPFAPPPSLTPVATFFASFLLNRWRMGRLKRMCPATPVLHFLSASPLAHIFASRASELSTSRFCPGSSFYSVFPGTADCSSLIASLAAFVVGLAALRRAWAHRLNPSRCSPALSVTTPTCRIAMHTLSCFFSLCCPRSFLWLHVSAAGASTHSPAHFFLTVDFNSLDCPHPGAIMPPPVRSHSVWCLLSRLAPSSSVVLHTFCLLSGPIFAPFILYAPFRHSAGFPSPYGQHLFPLSTPYIFYP